MPTLWQRMTARKPPEELPVIRCKVCDQGQLEDKTLFRMSWPVVIIGHILLIPSIIGMGIGIVMFAYIVAPINENNNGGIGAIAGGSSAVIVFGLSFVGGLIGWLLVMKKRVLQCSWCRAVINAS
jgi:hypothetical protein